MTRRDESTWRRWPGLAGSVLVVLVAASGCGAPSSDAVGQPSSSELAAANGSGLAAADGPDGTAATIPDAAASPPRPDSPDEVAAEGGAGENVDESDEPEPADTQRRIELELTLSPTCVTHGDAVTVTIDTEPFAVVAYQAIYSDYSGGGPPPYGAGHGGNAGGPAGPEGHYEDTFVVAPSAPTGPVEVTAVALAQREGRGDAMATFVVVEDTATGC